MALDPLKDEEEQKCMYQRIESKVQMQDEFVYIGNFEKNRSFKDSPCDDIQCAICSK